MSTETKSKIATVYLDFWQTWIDEGNEPATRDAAIKIMLGELRAAGIKLDQKEFSMFTARDNFSEGGSVISSMLSFAVWDLTENDGKALNYSVGANYLDGLMEQSRQFISHARFKLVIGKQEHTFSTFVHVKGQGQRPLHKLSPQEIEEVVQRQLSDMKITAKRWKALGADFEFIQDKLTELRDETLAEYTTK